MNIFKKIFYFLFKCKAINIDTGDRKDLLFIIVKTKEPLSFDHQKTISHFIYEFLEPMDCRVMFFLKGESIKFKVIKQENKT
jgi:hypothetical protein